MRKWLLGAAAITAIAAPGLASAEDAAVVGLSYTNIDPSGSNNIGDWGLHGAYSHDFSNGWTLQTDGSEDRFHVSGSSFGDSYGAVHLGMRTEGHSLAGFLGMSDFAGLSGINGGVEGQLFVNNLVFDGSLGYEDFSTAHFHHTNAHIDGSYFFNDDFALTGEVGYNDAHGGGSANWTVAGLSGAYRFAGSPTSVTLGYQNWSGDIDADVWTIGLNFDLGSDSLRARSEHGPSWNGASTLHTQFLF